MASIRRGDVYSIDIGDGVRGYAVALKAPLYGFFDCRSSSDLPLAEITHSAIAFRCCAFDKAVKTGRWKRVGSFVPDDKLDDMVFFRKDKLSGELETYSESGIPSQPISATQARQMEPAAVWTGEQIEDRLRDHFAHRPNKWLMAMMP